MLTAWERETVISFSEAPEAATVYTYNSRLKKQLAKLSEQKPNACRLSYKVEGGGVCYEIDKRYIAIVAPVKK